MSNEQEKQGQDKLVKSVNQRGAARLAAVQALYQMDIGGTGVLEVVAEYEAHRLGQELDGDTYLKADPSWFRSIVSGVVRDQTKIDPVIRSSLQEDWPLSRLDSTLRAILRAGTFEILERKDVPVPVPSLRRTSRASSTRFSTVSPSRFAATPRNKQAG
jgi:N utilization substance protein B